jgi:hypothetical protein
MNAIGLFPTGRVEASQIVRARIHRIDATGLLVTALDHKEVEMLTCELLQTAGGADLRLVEGDHVLVWRSDSDSPYGIILGRIGPSISPPQAFTVKEETPDELLIEARSNLTLKCGEGSITLRADGKILIKGKDLVSRAQRTVRIKGGTVAIN